MEKWFEVIDSNPSDDNKNYSNFHNHHVFLIRCKMCGHNDYLIDGDAPDKCEGCGAQGMDEQEARSE